MSHHSKLNSKVRFQGAGFRSRLKQAREYRRIARKIPDQQWEIALSRLGLSTWPRRIALVMVLGLLTYLAYFPNFLYVKTVELEGIDESNTQLVVEYFRKNRLRAAQNLALLSKAGLSKYLTERNDDILEVTEIKKEFPNRLKITAIPRVPEYLLGSGLHRYIVGNDGTVLAEYNNPSTTPMGLKEITLEKNEDLSVKRTALPDELLKSLREISRKMEAEIKLPISSFFMQSVKGEDITVKTVKNFSVLFDYKAGVETSLNQFKELMDDMTPGQEAGLVYVDMRFKNRGFLCFKDAACARPPEFTSASSTPTSTVESLTQPQ